MAAYQESNQQLKIELKLRKKGLQTLECLIKENSVRGNTYVEQPVSSGIPVEVPEPKVTQPLKIKYYVTGLNGMCVEIESPSTMIISEVISDIKRAFLSRTVEKGGMKPLNVLKLICRGKTLLGECTLMESGVLNGDTLVAIFESAVIAPAIAKKPIVRHVRDSESSEEEVDNHRNRVRKSFKTTKDADNNQMLELLKQQQEVLAKLSNDLMMEQTSRRQLQAQMEYYEKTQGDFILNQSRQNNQCKKVTVVAGDVEDDVDEVLVSREEVRTKLLLSNQRVSSLEKEVI